MASQTQPGPESPGQPTEEEMQAYLAQLREADPVELVAQAYTMLGTGAEVKLGRPDARTLIDALAGLVEAVQSHLPADLVERMRSGLSQLQMAQVEAERSAGSEAAGGAPSEQPAGESQPQAGEDAGAASRSDPSQTGAPPSGSAGRGDARMTDRLWIPGRDPRPR